MSIRESSLMSSKQTANFPPAFHIRVKIGWQRLIGDSITRQWIDGSYDVVSSDSQTIED